MDIKSKFWLAYNPPIYQMSNSRTEKPVISNHQTKKLNTSSVLRPSAQMVEY